MARGRLPRRLKKAVDKLTAGRGYRVRAHRREGRALRRLLWRWARACEAAR